MFAFIVIIFEAIAVLFIGIFARTATPSLSSIDNLTGCIILLLAFTLMYCPFKKLSLFSLVILLLTISIAGQTNILFGTFWDSCFNGFKTSF